MVLQRRERADPSAELDQRTPRGTRQVHERRAPPAKHQRAAEHHEEHEAEVQHHHRVGQRAIGSG
ncbi:MAG TPA: hypothetical protein VF771_05875 [Longimicrobiaceae bacterium]